MPEIIFQGSDGRLEGRFHPQPNPSAPVALVIQPDPRFGGTMNQKVVYHTYYAFHQCGFSVLRFNFRGVGRSSGSYDDGVGELSDAASGLDFLQSHCPNYRAVWIAGFGFGAWIGMQLLMRRPEINGFVAIAPPAGNYDFSFLAPCPTSGLIIQGSEDRVVKPEDVNHLVTTLRNQKGITIDHETIEGANHFFEPGFDTMIDKISTYINRRLIETTR